MEQTTYDVVVIGGGAAGLSGALALGRARRSVVVVDAGEPRNAPAGHVHNYLGREGTPPAELLEIGRGEVAAYGVELRSGRALSAVREDDSSFTVSLEDGVVRARRLLVTTGLVDVLPDVPGLAEGWSDTVLHCPYCHGWEVRDRAIGVLATGPMALHAAELWRQWSEDVVLFVHEHEPLTPEQAERLTARGTRVVTGRVVAWEDGRVRLASGETVARDVVVAPTSVQARAELLVSLGLEVAPLEVNGAVLGSFVPADPTGLTAVPGVWVAGNVTSPMLQVIGAAAGGIVAGAMINADLIADETAAAVHRARFFGRDSWEERYREKDRVWSGNPNAQLVAEASSLAPGTALDVGCGEGADALWLAGRGWTVTGTDISSVALDRAAAHASDLGLTATWRQADLTQDPVDGPFDLVTAHFMHLPKEHRDVLYARLAAAVAPGGTLLLVGHHPDDSHTRHGAHRLYDMLFTPAQLLDALDLSDFDVQVAEVRRRRAVGQDGVEADFHDTVVRAVRRG